MTSASLVPARRSPTVIRLQNEIRQGFHDEPLQRAVARALAAIGQELGVIHAALHANLGARLFAEEWSCDGYEPPDALRESVTQRLAEAVGHERARFARLGDSPELPSLVTVPVFDPDGQPAGAAGFVVAVADRAQALELLVLAEGLVGFLCVLAAEHATRLAVAQAATTPHAGRELGRAASDPQFLAFAIAARLKNRFPLAQVAVGLRAHRGIEVAAVCGIDELRASNPGVKLIRAAMEECLDRREPILHSGATLAESAEFEPDCRLHVQWSRAIGGDGVASFPLLLSDEVVAVVALRFDPTVAITPQHLRTFRQEVEAYAEFVPIARLATRSLLRHAADLVRARLVRWFGARHWRGWTALVVILLGSLLLAFGSMRYRFTVPCRVVAADPHIVASPRAGTLAELHAVPGQRVRAGELLGRLDDQQERLLHAQSEAEVARLRVLADRARAARDAAQAIVHEAELAAAQAQLALTRHRLAQSELRAPADAIVLRGDLRARVGARVALGEPLFELAHAGQVRVELAVPEHRIWDGRETEAALFAPAARPSETIPLQRLAFRPAAVVQDGRNVFVAESRVFVAPDHLSPGMEGTAELDIGDRPLWWILTHRVTDWLRLQFLW